MAHSLKLWMKFLKMYAFCIIDLRSNWATPWGSASQIDPAAKPQSERKSTTHYGDELIKC